MTTEKDLEAIYTTRTLWALAKDNLTVDQIKAKARELTGHKRLKYPADLVKVVRKRRKVVLAGRKARTPYQESRIDKLAWRPEKVSRPWSQYPNDQRPAHTRYRLSLQDRIRDILGKQIHNAYRVQRVTFAFGPICGVENVANRIGTYGGWPKYDYVSNVALRYTYWRSVIKVLPKGMCQGHVVLDLQPIGPTLYSATWLRQGRGYNLIAVSGTIRIQPGCEAEFIESKPATIYDQIADRDPEMKSRSTKSAAKGQIRHTAGMEAN